MVDYDRKKQEKKSINGVNIPLGCQFRYRYYLIFNSRRFWWRFLQQITTEKTPTFKRTNLTTILSFCSLLVGLFVSWGLPPIILSYKSKIINRSVS